MSNLAVLESSSVASVALCCPPVTSAGLTEQDAEVMAGMFKALGERGINILAISTSEIKISVLIDAAYAELAVRTLHGLYELGKD